MNRTRSKSVAAIIATICLFVVLVGFHFYNHTMVLEVDHWPQNRLHVTEATRNGSDVVNLSGPMIDSGLAIANVSTLRQGSSIIVLVHGWLTQAGFGDNGRLNYDVAVPKNVTNIRFGNKHAIVWQRNQRSN